MHLITNDALVVILREHICRNGGPSRYARRLGVSCAFVSAMLGGSKNVSGRILDDLGYERVVCFRKIETPVAPDTDVPAELGSTRVVPHRAVGMD